MDEAHRLPVELGPAASDEYEPVPLPPAVAEAKRRAWADIDSNARRAGIDRRQFLRSAAGAATVLLALDACTRESTRAAGERVGGEFVLPQDAAVDIEVAEAAFGEAFVFDVQTHMLEYDLSRKQSGSWFGQRFPQQRCGEDDPRECFSAEHYLEEVFLRSDTTVAVLSAIPAANAHQGPLSIEVMQRTKAMAEEACGEGRVLLHGHAAPNVGRLDAALAAMDDLAREHRPAAWKVYTHAPGPGWRLDRGVGEAFVDRAVKLGIPRICVHKGFSGGSAAASPADIGRAALDNPAARFVVYHSGYEPGLAEGPYRRRGGGVDRLITSLRKAGVRPNSNVYAELGSTWWNVMRSPSQAAHVLGKLLKHVGVDRVVWGTDSIWYGSPQGQLQAFKSFRISRELQERYGYPALTDEVKRKVLGLNAARLYGIDPAGVRCKISKADLDEARREL